MKNAKAGERVRHYTIAGGCMDGTIDRPSVLGKRMMVVRWDKNGYEDTPAHESVLIRLKSKPKPQSVKFQTRIVYSAKMGLRPTSLTTCVPMSEAEGVQL